LALIGATAGSAGGGLAAVIVKKIRTKPAAQPPTHDAPADKPAKEEEVR
jgi:acetyl esterase/lipase